LPAQPRTGHTNPPPVEVVRTLLSQGAGGDLEGAAIAEAAVRLWKDYMNLLAPILGARGVEALFGRSLHVTSIAFPALASVRDQADRAIPLGPYRVCLQACDPATALEASLAHLMNFTELVSTMIGANLLERLLGPVWAPPSLSSAPEALP
jgi:hypothetical protein